MSGIYFNPLKRVFLNLSGGTVTGDTIFQQGVNTYSLSGQNIFSGSTELSQIIIDIANSAATGATQNAHFLPLSGGTGGEYYFTGNTTGQTIYVENYLNVNSNFIVNGNTGLISSYGGITGTGLSGTFLSGTTNGFVIGNISDIQGIQTLVQPGTNIVTGGTDYLPTINLVASPSVNNINFSGTAIGGTVQASIGAFTSLSAGTISGGTLYSGSTNLYSIFSQTDTVTRVQPGTNILTGGTENAPTINLVASPSVDNINFSGTAIGGTVQAGAGTFTSFSAGTMSGGTLYSGSTNLYDIFSTLAGASDVTRVQPGSNISTGGTENTPTINLVASPSVNNINFSGTAIGGTVQAGAGTFISLSAGTMSGGTLYSGTTNLYSIFSQTDTVTRVQPGTNISTGGTANAPIINLIASPSVNGLTISGTTTGTIGNFSTLSATAITDSNLTSGQAVYASVGGLLKTNTGFTYDDVANRLYAQNMNIGSPSLSGTMTVWGDIVMMGAAISAFTSELYIEDNNVQLNYNPTADTTSTSLGAGWTIQDGSGLVGINASFDIRGASSGIANRSFATNLNDIRIRETGTVSAPNGVRVIAEGDVLDGGTF